MPVLERTSLQQEFHERGFVMVQGLLDQNTHLDPLRAEYMAILDALAEHWFQEGKLLSCYREQPFGRRLMSIVAETGEAYYQYFDISLPQRGLTEATPIHLGPAVFNLLRNPRLLDVVESLIG